MYSNIDEASLLYTSQSPIISTSMTYDCKALQLQSKLNI